MTVAREIPRGQAVIPAVRRDYAKIGHVLDMPKLIQVQIDSFDWFKAEGLRELLDEISPIQDFTGARMELSFGDYSFGEPKYSEMECRERDMTYSAPLRVNVELLIKETGEVKEQELFMGDFPLMTQFGTFVINGAERVVVSQLVRSPGAYFTMETDPSSGRGLCYAKLIPNRGAWLEFETSNKDIVSVKVDRKRKIPVTTLLRAIYTDPEIDDETQLGTDEQILALFEDVDTGDRRFIQKTLDKDGLSSEIRHKRGAITEFYKRLRPGDPPTLDNARSLINSLFFQPRRYDLGRVGRYKLNKRLGLPAQDVRVLRPEDLVAIVKQIIIMNREQLKGDDIDHLGNRRVRAVGELIQNQFRIGLLRMERVVRERMTITDPDAATPSALINIRPVVAAMKEFFGGSQLSQFMDQTNPLAELTHKRRLSALGPGGLSRDRAGFDVRDVHNSHYGRICPIETPEGPNIGLIGSLASYGKVNSYGFIETPYRRVVRELPSTDSDLVGHVFMGMPLLSDTLVIPVEYEPIVRNGDRLAADAPYAREWFGTRTLNVPYESVVVGSHSTDAVHHSRRWIAAWKVARQSIQSGETVTSVIRRALAEEWKWWRGRDGDQVSEAQARDAVDSLLARQRSGYRGICWNGKLHGKQNEDNPLVDSNLSLMCPECSHFLCLDPKCGGCAGEESVATCQRQFWAAMQEDTVSPLTITIQESAVPPVEIGDEITAAAFEYFRNLRERGIKIQPFVDNNPESIHYMSADEEERFVIAQANALLDARGHFLEDRVEVRARSEFLEMAPDQVDLVDVSPKQIVSVAASLIPFLEHDDANRALMGSNMQRQAVPLVRPEVPLVGTGMERQTAVDSGQVIVAARDGVVTSSTARAITVRYDDGEVETFPLLKFVRSNQGTCINQRPIVFKDDRVTARQPLADSSSTDRGDLALGQSVLCAFMSWEGSNFEDAIIISERVAKEDIFTSIHIEKHETEARDTKLGPEEITRDIPNVGEDALRDLDENGIIRIGAEVGPGDILVGKITPKGETELTAEEKLLRAIFGEKAREVKDTSLRVPHGERGKVIDVKVFNRDDHDELPAGVNKLVRVSIAQKRKIAEGDKMAGRHGNKGVVSRILKEEDMPYLADGTPIDIILNPIGVPSRMNVGQVLETHLGWAAKKLGFRAVTQVFDGASDTHIEDALGRAWIAMQSGAVKSRRSPDQYGIYENFEWEPARSWLEYRGYDPDRIFRHDITDFQGEARKACLELWLETVAERDEARECIEDSLRRFDPALVPAAGLFPRPVEPVASEDGEDDDDVELTRESLRPEGKGPVGKLDLPYEQLVQIGEDVQTYCRIAPPIYGKQTLYDGRTGENYENPVTVGYMYMLKLVHQVEDKIHARSTGPYSLITQQPLGGKAQFGGQRFGEMEVWALEAYGAAHILQELLTVKSDDIVGRVKTYEAIVKGDNVLEPGVPESFKVLVKELQSLGLSVEVLNEDEESVELLPDSEADLPELGINMSGFERTDDFFRL